jgi:hypothetical protein
LNSITQRERTVMRGLRLGVGLQGAGVAGSGEGAAVGSWLLSASRRQGKQGLGWAWAGRVLVRGCPGVGSRPGVGCVGAGGTRLGGWSARTSGRAVRSAARGCFMGACTGSTGTGRAGSRGVGCGRGLLLAAPGVGLGEREARGEKRERAGWEREEWKGDIGGGGYSA